MFIKTEDKIDLNHKKDLIINLNLDRIQSISKSGLDDQYNVNLDNGLIHHISTETYKRLIQVLVGLDIIIH